MSDPKTKAETEDPEMLKNLELLLAMDLLEAEDNWDEIETADAPAEDMPNDPQDAKAEGL